VDTLTELTRLLDRSADRNNPSAADVVRLLRAVEHVAVVGLSRHVDKPARRVPSYLAAKGYDVIPVNPNADRLLGRASFPRLSNVPLHVDLVLIFRPSAVAGGFVREAVEREDGPAIWLQQGIRAPDVVSEARQAGRLVVQDLCIFRAHRLIGQPARRV